ncbi:hypothetical protein [Blastococcus goldschmidtiae]|uniref:Uncharacterized protein n=1 Tax=Blastococcus goldschmidtiae TaxID=3075546 RepID=A0ABU2K5Y3_9ACTN|nr:hypothetical protein [Blastococcus sp. DSM 46792]MDT0275599.1 hypothetical protein [Blastococcus sp. DSM 46792]
MYTGDVPMLAAMALVLLVALLMRLVRRRHLGKARRSSRMPGQLPVRVTG